MPLLSWNCRIVVGSRLMASTTSKLCPMTLCALAMALFRDSTFSREGWSVTSLQWQTTAGTALLRLSVSCRQQLL